MRSLWATPKRCSSSMISRPSCLNCTSLDSRRWVPMTTSTVPWRSPSTTAFCSLGVRKRESSSTLAGKGAEALGEGGPVLLGEHGGGHQHRHLVAVADRLEGGAQRDFGLAVADVAGHQTVHRPRVLHVALDLFDRAQLVGRLLEAEGGLELALPRRVGREGVALGHRALGVELQQLLGHLAQRGAHRFLHALPGGAAHAVELGGARVAAQILRDEVEPLHRHVQPAALGVLEQQEIAVAITDRHRAQPEVAADPVVLVHDQVAHLEVGEGREGGAPLVLGPAQRAAPRAEDLRPR